MAELDLVRDALAAFLTAHGIQSPTKMAPRHTNAAQEIQALVSQIPMATADALFAKLDLNRDGVIDKSEWPPSLKLDLAP